MQRWHVLSALALTYVTFAILLNSVGTVIMQVVNIYGVSKPEAATLEGFKDLPIAIISFLIASSLPRFGFRRAMTLGLAIVALVCLAMPYVPAFWMTKLLFFTVGSCFALVKVGVYASVGLICSGTSQHASTLNIVEGLFMLGVLAGYWLFGWFISDSAAPHDWLEVYWWIAGLCALNILLWRATPLDESQAVAEATTIRRDFIDMLKLLALPIVYLFVISAFLYVLIEQGVGTWLPTFNNKVLGLPPDMSVQATSIFAASLAIGRLSAGALMRYINWYPLLNLCLVAMAVLILLTLPLTQDVTPTAEEMNWWNVPIAAYIFPFIGLCMAPIYPAINSVMLSALSTHRHAAMTGLIVIFSALGGTTGSFITGLVFEEFDGQTAFYTALIPIIGILLSLFGFRRFLHRHISH